MHAHEGFERWIAKHYENIFIFHFIVLNDLPLENGTAALQEIENIVKTVTKVKW